MRIIPRSDKELLRVLLSNIDQLSNGLCWLCFELKGNGIISDSEHDRLLQYISIHRPKTGVKFQKYYFWEKGEKESRIQWLKNEINK